MTYKELQKCQLPVEVKWNGDTAIITSYNRAGLLVTCLEEDYNVDIEILEDFSLKPEINAVTLYKYNYYDKARGQYYETSWTTEKWSEYMPQNGNFESISFKKKVIEIEED